LGLIGIQAQTNPIKKKGVLNEASNKGEQQESGEADISSGEKEE